MDWGRGRRRLPRLRTVGVVVLAVVVLAGAGVVVQLVRAAPALAVTTTIPARLTVPGPAPSMPWPPSGQATVSVEGIGSLGQSGGDQALPIASLTKVMTAYVVVSDHPLAGAAQGPAITMSAGDAASAQAGLAQGESELKVAAGEQLTERQALEALLVPSANNIASALAVWDAGSAAAFVAKMNSAAAALGMSHTHYADAVGLDSNSVSTAVDQVVLGQKVMQLPVLASIVAMPQATFPVAGTVFNYDNLVGRDGIVGIKTGSTGAAGGNFLFAARRQVGTRPVLIVGAVLAQHATPILQTALTVGRALIDAAGAAVQVVTAASAGVRVASIAAPWARKVGVATTSGAFFLGWGGLSVNDSLHIRTDLGGKVRAGTRLGVLDVRLGEQSGSIPVAATGTIDPAPLSWKLRRL
ncbi:MAG TPA: hypothetical protein VE990_03145 [Acidimicrobiales bacterium]|nr:hypothetical protein [Acidimicrobiales bacterium]